jgi:hypothetical protein
MVSGLAADANYLQKEGIKGPLAAYLKSVAARHKIAQDYNIVVLFDMTQIAQQDADNIYAAVTSFVARKPILLVLHSMGGSIAAAYLIGKMLQEHSPKLVIVVPRRAKSAATLLCCASQEIHMGSLSELGPIDPQIKDMPVLGLKDSIEHLAALVAANPGSADMFAKYLSSSLPLIHLGYYERVAESAVQYAERSLAPHHKQLRQPSSKIAHDLVHSYKDHGFVIDSKEATEIFGPNVVKTKTPEYDLGNDLYGALKTIERYAEVLGHGFYLIGDLTGEPAFSPQK